MDKKSQHVVPSLRGWMVVKAGSSKPSSTHASQREAIAKATTVAKNQKTDLFIHGRDGRIRERSSFGSDPVAPKRA